MILNKKLRGSMISYNPVSEQIRVVRLAMRPGNVTVVVVRLEHSHSFNDSFDNHSTASGPAWCRRCRPPGNAVFNNVPCGMVALSAWASR